MRDMVPPERRSIRNIPVSAARRHREVEDTSSPEEDAVDAALTRERPRMVRRPPRRKRIFLFSAIAVVAVCAIGGLLLSTLFAGATVTVYPKTLQVTPPKTIVAKLQPATNELRFQTMTVTRSASTAVQASGSKQVSRSASGLITIYNTASAESQRLIANTRFEAPDGKIYRIHDSVVVPGTTKAADGSVTPGTATAMVYADSPGDTYNKGQTRFTIPGFKGDPKYTSFYAQAPTLAGGYIGPEPTVAAADLAQGSELLKQGLSQAAQSLLTSQIPEGYVAVPGSLQVTFSNISQTPGDAGNATLSQTATMTGDIVQTGDLAAAIARTAVDSYNGEAIGFADIAQLTLAAATTTKPGDNLTITLGGSPTLVWQYDPAALKTALTGKSKGSFQSIIESFAPAITRAEAKVRPFWESSFPSDPAKIEVLTGTQK